MIITNEIIGKRCLIKSSLKPNQVTEVKIEEISPKGEYVRLGGTRYAGPTWLNVSEVEVVEVLERSTVLN